MAEARVRIVLDDGPDGGNTWVTYIPVRRHYPSPAIGVVRAAGEALSVFIENILRDSESVDKRLADLEGHGD